MKRLYIVDDRRPLWHEIALMLEEIHAEIRVLSRDDALRAFREERPDLLILGEESRQLVGQEARETIKIVVGQETPPGSVIRSREGRNIVRLGWPTDKGSLFELTRRMLTVPERRPHRTPVLIVTRDDRTLPGESEDFSLSGMAFRTASALAPDDEVSVSFGEEGRGDGLRLEAAVVRSSPGRPGEATLYGVRFLRLTPTDRHALERFVWRIRRRTS